VLLKDITIGVWCAIPGGWIIGPLFFRENKFKETDKFSCHCFRA